MLLLRRKPRGTDLVGRAASRLPVEERWRPLFLRAGSRAHEAILRQPLQLFAHFDLSVPGVLIKLVSLAGENQQLSGNVQFMQSAIEQVILEHRHPNVIRPGNDVGWRADFVN